MEVQIRKALSEILDKYGIRITGEDNQGKKQVAGFNLGNRNSSEGIHELKGYG